MRSQAGLPAIRSVYQPIVDLDDGSTVGYEALVRGAVGAPLYTPAELFGWAHDNQRLADLDWACRLSAVGGAVGLPPDVGLFVNVEPTTADLRATALFDRLAELADASGTRLVVEVTERRLAEDVGSLLRFLDQVRDRGWSVAIDDVGAMPASLALMPLLAPDVIKLDLALIQARTTVDTARIVNAVMAQAERTGAVVLAEGIETPAHEELARSMGAHLGQGWLYGRPGDLPATPVARPLRLATAGPARPPAPATPWDLVRGHPGVRRARKPLLLAMSQHLERQVFAGDDATLLFGALQLERYFYPVTARRYEKLAATAFLVAVFGADVPASPVPGVRGQGLSPKDPLLDEWTVVVITPHFAGALIAHDIHDAGRQGDRRFDYVVTFDRNTVLAAAASLLLRMQPWGTARAPAADVAEARAEVRALR